MRPQRDSRSRPIGLSLEDLQTIGSRPSRLPPEDLQTIQRWKREPKKVTEAIRASTPEEVQHAFTLLREGHLETNALHCSAAITSYREGKAWMKAIGTFSSMAQKSIPCNEVTHNLALSSFAAGNQWVQSLQHLISMKLIFIYPSAVSFCSVLVAVSRESLWQAALAIFEEMQGASVQADVISFNTVISACGRGGQWLLAVDLLDQVKSSVRPTDASYSATISACGTAFKWQHAVALLQDMSTHKLTGRNSYNAAISACEKCGQWLAALALLHKMAEVQISKDRVTCNAAIGACAKSAQWAAALSLFHSMHVNSIEPGAITHNTVITACENGLQWRLVLALTDADPGFTSSTRSTATELHHAVRQLTKQAPSQDVWDQGDEAARRASRMVGEFKPKELVSLLRAFASMLVTKEALFREAAEILPPHMGAGVLQAQELANLCWAYAVGTAAGSHKIFRAAEEAFIQRRAAFACGSLQQDDAARDFAEGLLGTIWSLSYSQNLQPGFLRFAQSALLQLTEPLRSQTPELPSGSQTVAGMGPREILGMPGVVVIHKPAGWCVDQGEESLAEGDDVEDMNFLSSFVSTRIPARRFPILSDKLHWRGFVHRIDVPSSGLILTATSHQAFYSLRLQTACGSFVRDYQVLCHGWLRGRQDVRAAVHWVSDGRTTSSLISPFGRPALTRLRLSASFLRKSEALSLFMMRIGTGRKHQIRVQSAHVGHAVVCDGRYSTPKTYRADLKWCPRNFLHRSRLGFTMGGKSVDVEQALPQDLSDALWSCTQVKRAREEKSQRSPLAASRAL
ncbi:unnamed protein product [Symbiodinium natans]|uniref:Pseudouridine synthase RsuA/RluA-like domain-containing protein n=1 Tax=Symbiodinium natans TaxID=878477 RepID=A0A812IL53_9DINO|nr:unnamed protein product [Symbiodinium natans]